MFFATDIKQSPNTAMHFFNIQFFPLIKFL